MSKFKQLAYAALCSATVLAAGCRNDNSSPPVQPVDLLSPPADLAVNSDIPASSDMPVNTTSVAVHDIDVAPLSGTGTYTGTTVTVKNLYMFDRPAIYYYKTGNQCEYHAPVQQTTCTTPPCGLVVYFYSTVAPTPSPTPISAKNCPLATDPGSGSGFGSITEGDTIDVTGVVRYFKTAMGGMANQHYIVATSITKSATQATRPTPVIVTDPSLFEAGKIYASTNGSYIGLGTGTGWATYEGTYVSIAPTGGFTAGPVQPSPAPVPALPTPDQYGNFAGIAGSSTVLFNRASYLYPGDLGDFPTAGQQFTSLGGWVDDDYGGTIDQIDDSDYVAK